MGFHLCLLSHTAWWLSRLPTTCGVVCARGRCLQQSLLPCCWSLPSQTGCPITLPGAIALGAQVDREANTIQSLVVWSAATSVCYRLWAVRSRYSLWSLASAAGWAPSGQGTRWAVWDSGLPATTTEWQISWNLFITSCYKFICNTPLLKFFSSYRNLELWPADLLIFSATDRTNCISW